MAKRSKRERNRAKRAQMGNMALELKHAQFRLLRLAAAGQLEAIHYYRGMLHEPDAADDAVVAWARRELEEPIALESLALFEPDEYMALIEARTGDYMAAIKAHEADRAEENSQEPP